jgi:hypothetical protein
MQTPDEYRSAAHRSAILNELVKFLMKRLTATDAPPVVCPKMFVNEATVPDAAFQDMLLEILLLKREADRVMASYRWICDDEPAESVHGAQAPASTHAPRRERPNGRRAS